MHSAQASSAALVNDRRRRFARPGPSAMYRCQARSRSLLQHAIAFVARDGGGGHRPARLVLPPHGRTKRASSDAGPCVPYGLPKKTSAFAAGSFGS